MQAQKLAALLKQHHLSLATAESCTGGKIAAAITDMPGSSAYFGYGLVTYSNQAKIALLQVPAIIIEQFGAVSSQTAEAMARGIKNLAQADLALAVTGIAGPDGATAQKPLGLVYIAALFADKLIVEEHVFSGNRQQVRNATVEQALILGQTIIGENI